MARISIEKLYCCEGSGAKCGTGRITDAVMQEIMIHGIRLNENDGGYYG